MLEAGCMGQATACTGVSMHVKCCWLKELPCNTLRRVLHPVHVPESHQAARTACYSAICNAL